MSSSFSDPGREGMEPPRLAEIICWLEAALSAFSRICRRLFLLQSSWQSWWIGKSGTDILWKEIKLKDNDLTKKSQHFFHHLTYRVLRFLTNHSWVHLWRIFFWLDPMKAFCPTSLRPVQASRVEIAHEPFDYTVFWALYSQIQEGLSHPASWPDTGYHRSLKWQSTVPFLHWPNEEIQIYRHYVWRQSTVWKSD